MVKQQNDDQLSTLGQQIKSDGTTGDLNFHPETALEPEEKKALLAEEEAKQKEREAEEARRKAEQAVNEALRKEKEAKVARQRAMLAAADLKRKQEQKDRERKFLWKKSHKSNIIPPDDGELLDGTITLTFNPGAQYANVSSLVKTLCSRPNIKEVARGGIAGQGSWIKFSLDEPIPLFRVLYSIPPVQEITRKGMEITVKF